MADLSLDIRKGPRRPGDPAELVAGAGRIRDVLAWRPQFNDLETIVSDALRWERALLKKNARKAPGNLLESDP